MCCAFVMARRRGAAHRVVAARVHCHVVVRCTSGAPELDAAAQVVQQGRQRHACAGGQHGARAPLAHGVVQARARMCTSVPTTTPLPLPPCCAHSRMSSSSCSWNGRVGCPWWSRAWCCARAAGVRRARAHAVWVVFAVYMVDLVGRVGRVFEGELPDTTNTVTCYSTRLCTMHGMHLYVYICMYTAGGGKRGEKGGNSNTWPGACIKIQRRCELQQSSRHPGRPSTTTIPAIYE